MKRLTNAVAGILIASIMLVCPLFGLTGAVSAGTTRWQDDSGDVYDIESRDGGYALSLWSDNGDGRVTCPSTVNGVPVVSYKTTMTSLETRVTSIAIAENAALTELLCGSDYNTSLDLSKCPNLTSLYCDFTNISSLDISCCPNLQVLYIYETNIRSIDISNNRTLLDCYLSPAHEVYQNATVGLKTYMLPDDVSSPRMTLDMLISVTYSGNDMHRLYNPNSGEHFYTVDTVERDNLISSGWNYEGIAWTAPRCGDPVYRVYNQYAGDHHYTTNYQEVQNLVDQGWTYEGIGWYTAPSYGSPLYRLYNRNCTGAGSHHYTTVSRERDDLITQGWQYEGIGWYGL